MKTSQILRSAALVLSMAAFTAGATAQTLTVLDTQQPELIAMTSVRDADEKVDTRAARSERMAESVAAVKGFEATAELRAAIEQRLVQDAPEAKVLRTVFNAENWSVKMTEIGLPKSEYRRGVVVYQLPGQDVVIHQQVVVERPYFALTDDAMDYSVRLGTPRAQ